MYIGVDVGGTKTLVAAFNETGEIQKELRFATDQAYDQFLANLGIHLKQIGDSPVAGCAIAIPGRVDHTNGIGIRFGNLPWHNVPVKTDLEKLVGCPVIVENDAKAGSLSEAMLLINEFKRVLYITIGTGIGISFIENGVIDHSVDDGGGHSYLVDHDGKQEAWESFAAGRAIKERYGKIAGEITDEQAWKEIAHDFAAGIVPLSQHYNPEVVIIGGGVGVHFDRFGSLLEQELAGLPNPPALRAAQRPEEAVVYGCYELARSHA